MGLFGGKKDNWQAGQVSNGPPKLFDRIAWEKGLRIEIARHLKAGDSPSYIERRLFRKIVSSNMPSTFKSEALNVLKAELSYQSAQQRQLNNQIKQLTQTNAIYSGPLAQFYQSYTIDFTGKMIPIQPPTNPNEKKDTPMAFTIDEKRRKTSDVRWCDIKKGDVVRDMDVRESEGLYTITRITGTTMWYKRNHDGYEGYWQRNTETLKSDGNFTLVKPRTKVKFDDVILPQSAKDEIEDAIKQVDNYELIFEKWGFGNVLEKGRAISMLFYGPPGTGKTLMAQAIADKYDYKLKVISTAEIESSEPGQAERNIKAYFEAAQKDGKTVLLFDECDSLIHDRRGVGMILGAQINALLTCLENFEGIAIFTTNRLEKMDEAFNRRLSLKLEFGLPDLERRIAIWKRMFPKQAPLADDINWTTLASVEIAGGYIKNVVLRAARKAANSSEQKITNQILVHALKEEIYTMTDFEEAVNSNTTPRMMGGGAGYGLGRGVTKTVTEGAGK